MQEQLFQVETLGDLRGDRAHLKHHRPPEIFARERTVVGDDSGVQTRVTGNSSALRGSAARRAKMEFTQSENITLVSGGDKAYHVPGRVLFCTRTGGEG